MTPKRVALVGLGRMGRHHLRVLAETPGFDVVAVVDPKGPASSELGGVRCFSSVRELDRLGIDAAIIATPTETHCDVALELIAMGTHLLIEKPLTATFVEGRAVIDAAHQRGTLLAVGHVERFNPAVRKLREAIAGGMLGAPIHFAFTRVGGYPETPAGRSSGKPPVGNNVILDLAVHDIDVLRSILGSLKVEHSRCHVSSRQGVFDTAEIFFTSGGGATASVHVNWLAPTKIRSIRVTGTRGVGLVDYVSQTCEVRLSTSAAGSAAIALTCDGVDVVQLDVQKIEPLRAQAEQFHAMLTTGDAGEICTGEDALAAVLLAERAVEIGDIGHHCARVVPPGANAVSAADDWV